MEHFNPFDGDKVPKFLQEKNVIYNMFQSYSEIIHAYLISGFDKKKILEIPAGWMMNVSIKELNLLMNYYGLKPVAEDVAINLDLVHNSQFREILLKTLISVASNFVIRNGLVNMSEVDNWYDVKTLKMIKNSF